MSSKTIQVALGIGFAAALAANIAWAIVSIRHATEKPEEKHEEAKRLTHDEEGNSVLKVDKETQERTALKVQPLEEVSLPPEVRAYGRLQEDPARSFTLRSPVAGVVRRTANRDWPRIGETVADGTELVSVQPRFAPLERVDLQSRLTAAQAETASAAAALEVAQASLDRVRTLNSENKTLSDRSLQEAEAKVKSETARLKAARETAAAVEASLGARAGATGPLSLAVERGGEVVELLAQPGETIESGQPILRVARYDRLLARIALSSGARVPGEVAAARLVPLGLDDRVFAGTRIAMAPAADPQLLGDTYLFGIEGEMARLRPGMAVTAWLALPGEPHKGVIIPRSAIVRLEGEMWVYLKTGDDKFTRREVKGARPVDKGWFAPEGFKAGENVAVAGAQMLLSEELKSKIQGED